MEVEKIDEHVPDVLSMGAHDVEDRHLMTLFNESVDDVGTDEPATPDDPNSHSVAPLSPRTVPKDSTT